MKFFLHYFKLNHQDIYDVMYEVLYLNIDSKALLAVLNDTSPLHPSFIIFSLAEDINAALFTNAAAWILQTYFN